MGIFASLLQSDHPADVFIDFENAKPTGSEEKVYANIGSVLATSEAALTQIKEYKGCANEQRAAMENATPDAESKCFEALLEAVKKINGFYQLAKKLENQVPSLLEAVCTKDSEGKQTLSHQQALAKQIAEILNFTLIFDEQRMRTPTVPNDFSYYRRLLSKFASHPDVIVGDDEASTMAMFTADHLPMMSSVTKAASNAQKVNEQVSVCFALMANSCLGMIKSKKFSSPDTNLFCARAMTGAIVVYDRISDFGVFHKRSLIQLKACVLLLKQSFPSNVELLNAIQFSAATFRTAPPAIQALFE